MATLDTLTRSVAPIDHTEAVSGGILVFFFFYWLGYQFGRG